MYVKTGKPMGRPVGFKLSEESKALMRAKKLGIKKTEEHKQHIRETNMGNRLMKFPNGEAHRVYAKTFDELLLEAQEKNWWLDKEELKILWEELEAKRNG